MKLKKSVTVPHKRIIVFPFAYVSFAEQRWQFMLDAFHVHHSEPHSRMRVVKKDGKEVAGDIKWRCYQKP